MKEIERKYLLRDSILSLIHKYGLKTHKITQFYTTITPDKGVRYRQMDDHYFKTIKHGTGASRDEEEVEISEKKFQKKFEDRIKEPIRKNRYMFHFEGKEYSIDVFKKDFKGLYMLEIEFPSMEDFEQFKLPPILKAHVIKDVSFDESFKNKNMVLHGRPKQLMIWMLSSQNLTKKTSMNLMPISSPISHLWMHCGLSCTSFHCLYFLTKNVSFYMMIRKTCISSESTSENPELF